MGAFGARASAGYLCYTDDLCDSLKRFLLGHRALSAAGNDDDDDDADDDQAADDTAHYQTNLNPTVHTTVPHISTTMKHIVLGCSTQHTD